MLMIWWRLPLFALVAIGAEAFVHARIRWEGLTSKPVFLSFRAMPLRSSVSMANVPQQALTIKNQPDRAPPDKIPHFTTKPDETIEWDGTGMCISAGKRGDPVHVDLCTGRPTQLWNLLPGDHDGENHIQLKGTNSCLYVTDEIALNGAQVELRECEDEAAELWQFEESTLPHERFPTTAPSMRHVMFFSIAMMGLGALSLRSWWWARRRKACAVVSQVGVILDDQGGVCLTVPSIGWQDSACCNASTNTRMERMVQWTWSVGPAMLKPQQTRVSSIVMTDGQEVIEDSRTRSDADERASNRIEIPIEEDEIDDRFKIFHKLGLALANVETTEQEGEEEPLDLKTVTAVLKSDIPKIMVRDLDWRIFAEDLELIDQTGSTARGRMAAKVLVKLLRRLRKKFGVNDDVRFTLDRYTEKFFDREERLLRARWTVECQGAERPWMKLEEQSPVTICVETIFHLNEKFQIDSVQVDKWLANGNYFPVKLQLWPALDATICPNFECVRSTLTKINAWAADIKELQPLSAGTVENIKKQVVPNRRDVVNALGLQFVFLVIGKGEIERASRMTEQSGAISSLEADLPSILLREPNFDLFEDDFMVQDQGSVVVRGLNATRRLCKLLRNLNDTLLLTPLKAEFQVKTQRVVSVPPGAKFSEPVLFADWTIEIDTRPRIPYDIPTELESQLLARVKIANSNFPLCVSGRSCFRFTKYQRMVKSINFDNWSVNGNQASLPTSVFQDLLDLLNPFSKKQEDQPNDDEAIERRLTDIEKKVQSLQQDTRTN